MGVSIGIIAIKGGVGKTTISASLASELARTHDKKVLLIDGNYSAPNLGLHMGIVTPDKTIHHVLSGKVRLKSAVHECYGVDVIPGSYFFPNDINPLKLKDKISGIKQDYDFIIIDGSPSLNEEILSTMLASDVLFVVSTPDYPTLSCSLRAARLAKQRGKPIAGIILNKIRDPSYELSLHAIEEVTGIPVIAKIPDEKIHTKALFYRTPTSIYKENSKFSHEIRELTNALNVAKSRKRFWSSFFSFAVPREAINRELLKEQFYTEQFFFKER
ncbi:AAA family ATPase [Candidatus Pacearchaeota archaeon]|nr:AAA family ATPase [Candidatus Pacearchaeota archaeon]